MSSEEYGAEEYMRGRKQIDSQSWMEWASHLNHHGSLADYCGFPVPLDWIESDKTRKSDGLRIIKYQQLRHGNYFESYAGEKSPIFEVTWAASTDSVGWYHSYRRKDAIAVAKGEKVQQWSSGPLQLPKGKVIKFKIV